MKIFKETHLKITDKTILFLPTGHYVLTPTLELRVAGERRAFVSTYEDRQGFTREITIGNPPLMSLRVAKRVAKVIEKVSEDIHEGTSAVLTFVSFAEETIQTLQKVRRWKRNAQKREWLSTLRVYAYPFIGNKEIGTINREDILQVLAPIWESKPCMAKKLRNRLELIFSYAITQGVYKEPNPAAWRGNLEMVLPPTEKIHDPKHFPTVPPAVLKQEIKKIDTSTIIGSSVLFGILTATRSFEFSQMKWDEIDFDKGIWELPPSRRKDGAKEPFRIPLSSQAISLLTKIERIGEFVFSRNGKAPIHKESPRHYLQRVIPLPCSMHGMRSTYRDWCAETGVDYLVAEKSLMHSVGNSVVLAYQRSDLLEQRRVVAQAWSNYLLEHTKCCSSPTDE